MQALVYCFNLWLKEIDKGGCFGWMRGGGRNEMIVVIIIMGEEWVGDRVAMALDSRSFGRDMIKWFLRAL